MAADETLRVDPAVMQGFAAALCGGAESLRTKLAELDGDVADVLGGWCGGAGSAYSAAWEPWHRGAGEVQLGLAILAKAVGDAAVDYQGNESASAAALGGVVDG